MPPPRNPDRNAGLSLIKKHLANCQWITDIGDINYTSNAKKLQKFQKITDPFCDNILVVVICDKSDCNKTKNANDIKVKPEKNTAIKETIRHLFDKFKLHEGAVKKITEILYEGNPSSKMRKMVHRILENSNLKHFSSDPNAVFIIYKIELADLDLPALLNKLPDISKKLEGLNILIANFDITQDFAGIFNKNEMRDYLTNYFQSNGRTDIKFEEIEKVGKDCLIWDDHNAKVKIYNKFICEMTCPGVRETLGNHIVDFINNRDDRIRQTFASELAKKHGITRLEATIYYGYNSKFYSIGNSPHVLKNNLEYLQSAPFYSVPISSMWTKLTDELRSCLCVVINRTLLFAYWGNNNTKKITGVEINFPNGYSNREDVIKNLLSAFSFKQLPIYYIKITGHINNDLNQQPVCYTKNEGKTYFSRSPISGNSNLTFIPEDIIIEDTGLVNTTNVEPEVLRTRTPIPQLDFATRLILND